MSVDEGGKSPAVTQFVRSCFITVISSIVTMTIGDSLSHHAGMKFSTFDQDNDGYKDSCAVPYGGAWWYNSCRYSNLNGMYLHGSTTSYADGVVWRTWTGYHYSLRISEMKIRPSDFGI